MSFKVKWPVEHDEALKKYHEQGLSFAQIGNAIALDFPGAWYSRNACIGRAARLGLKPRATSASSVRNGIPRQKREPVPAGAPSPLDRMVRSRDTRQFAAAPKSEREASGVPKLGRQRGLGMHLRPGKPDYEPDPTPLRAADIVPLNLSLFDLKEDTCRWPYGGWPTDDTITFCGHTTLDKNSYCPAHHELSAGRGTLSERQATLVPKCEAA